MPVPPGPYDRRALYDRHDSHGLRGLYDLYDSHDPRDLYDRHGPRDRHDRWPTVRVARRRSAVPVASTASAVFPPEVGRDAHLMLSPLA
ncbi:hypothetical protein OG339_17995 [Streptosporangium sp. NBC_01495]|uniref:hypothetical protein n=1 Tax=Streptosporangium sp. NBC_01495 TaxID=2903899 RepID=UPI002E3490FF|nr:hypothetical protein [Streptosporangium sp. NBC_01495]